MDGDEGVVPPDRVAPPVAEVGEARHRPCQYHLATTVEAQRTSLDRERRS
jgi:hypothetical protein